MFRGITLELRTVRDVVHGARNLAEHIGTRVEPTLSELSEELAALPPGWLTNFQLSMADWLMQDRGLVVDSEIIHRKELRKLDAERKNRNEAKVDLYGVLLKGRTFLEGALRAGASAELIGLDPNLGEVEGLVLMRYGTEAMEGLSSPDFEPQVMVIDGEVLTPAQYAERIREATEMLQLFEDEVAAQERVVERTLKVKTELLAVLKKRSLACARILEAIYVLAGEEFHAVRLRRSTRRRRSGAEHEPDDLDDLIVIGSDPDGTEDGADPDELDDDLFDDEPQEGEEPSTDTQPA